MDCPFDPTPKGFDAVAAIAEKAARNVGRIPSLPVDRPPVQARVPFEMATLRDYCKRHRIRVRPERRRQVAATLVEMTHRAQLKVGQVPDERFGRINCYPLDVLDRWRATLER